VFGNLRYLVLAWAAAALGYSTTQATSLQGVVAVGTAIGAVVASMQMRWTGPFASSRWASRWAC
jgi:LPLT family lysophospholipid transporter-like MFS transporter